MAISEAFVFHKHILFVPWSLILILCQELERFIEQKTLWEKEKMLATSIFSFFPQCFQILFSFMIVKSLVC